MTKPIIRIHDLATDEVIDREMTDAEYAKYEAEVAADAAQLQAIEKATEAKAKAEAKLTTLGLTKDDLKALGF